MADTLQFSAVNCGKIKALSFALQAGAVAVLPLADREQKAAVVDLVLGECLPDAGTVMLAGSALDAVPAGSLGWVPDMGGLIGNLKTWENVTLPLWYHGKRDVAAAEGALSRWLARLGVPHAGMAVFMASPVARLNALERKRAGLLRGLLLAPRVLVVDGGLFSGVPQEEGAAWMAALDELVAADRSKSVLVVAAPGDPALPWQMITTE